jgi:hypothetical protein
VSRPRTDWRTALPLLHALVAADAPAWVTTRTRKAVSRALDYLAEDVKRLVRRAGSAAAAAEVIGVAAPRLSEWSASGALGGEKERGAQTKGGADDGC